MEMVPAGMLGVLASWLAQGRSKDATASRAADKRLSSSPDCVIALLGLAASESQTPVDRIDASVRFKNILRNSWPKLSPATDAAVVHLPAADRAVIKARLFDICVKAPPVVQLQLSQALATAAASTPLKEWASPSLPSIFQSLTTAVEAKDFATAKSLLVATAALFSRFCNAFDSNALRVDLKYCHENFAASLLKIFLFTSDHVHAISGAATDLELLPVFECLRLCCVILYSLESINRPEFSVDHSRDVWMTEFLKFLTTPYPPSLVPGHALDEFHGAVCHNLELYMDKYEDQFSGCLKDFVEAVQELLMAQAASCKFTVPAIRFLTAVGKSVNHPLLLGPEAIEQLFHHVIMPCLYLQNYDRFLFGGSFSECVTHRLFFEDTWVEYVKCDLEEADSPRRGMLRMLLGLQKNYQDQVLELVIRQLNHMCEAYTADHAKNWKELEAALFILVTAGDIGCDDMENFLTAMVVPGLLDNNLNPMLKATILIFLKKIKIKIPKATAVALLPHIVTFLTHKSRIIVLYAANFIENLLIIEDVARAPLLAADDINPFVQQIIQNLSKALAFPYSYEYPYLMKCMLEVLRVAHVGAQDINCIAAAFLQILGKICECDDPDHPNFNRYLFEALAVLVGWAGVHKPLFPVLEGSFFPLLDRLFAKGIRDVWLYAVQILAQFIDVSNCPLSQRYAQAFQDLLLDTSFWKQPPCVPALVLLLQAYLRKFPSELSQGGKLVDLLGRFASFVRQDPPAYCAFDIVSQLVENIDAHIMQPYMNGVWVILLHRLGMTSEVKFANSVTMLMSLVLFVWLSCLLRFHQISRP